MGAQHPLVVCLHLKKHCHGWDLLLLKSSKNSVSSRDIDNDSRPIIPEELFRRSSKNLSSSVGSAVNSVPDTLSNNGSGDGSQQKLLVCSRCSLCVHSGLVHHFIFTCIVETDVKLLS